jgi:hypothetical protein
MANYLLLHGAASTGWIWHRLEAGLRELGQCNDCEDRLRSLMVVGCGWWPRV